MYFKRLSEQEILKLKISDRLRICVRATVCDQLRSQNELFVAIETTGNFEHMRIMSIFFLFEGDATEDEVVLDRHASARRH